MEKISRRFNHGLGDSVTFAHALPLWIKRDYEVEIEPWRGHDDLFLAAGATITDRAERDHPYPHPWIHPHPGIYPQPEWNKSGTNLKTAHMPDIGRRFELWDEYLAVRLDLTPYQTVEGRDRVDQFRWSLDGPLVVLHGAGDTSVSWHRSFGDRNEVSGVEVQRGLAAHAEVLVLDHGGDVPVLDHPKVHTLRAAVGDLAVADLAYLLEAANLVVAIDSGPQQLTRCTSVPALAVWFDTHPAVSTLPRAETTHLTDIRWRRLNGTQAVQTAYKVVQARTITAATVVAEAVRMLNEMLPPDPT